MKITYETLLSETGGFSKEMLFHRVAINPTMASKLLSHNHYNRPLRSSLVKKYADQMHGSSWLFNGDTIRFDRNGNLSDGQNRLHAIINSGTTQEFNIQSGLNVDTFKTIDTGKNRTGSDIVYLHGIKNSSVVASAIRLVINYDNLSLTAKKGTITNTDVEKFIKDPANSMSRMEEYAQIAMRLLNKQRFYTASIYCAFLYIFSRKHGSKSIEFFDMLVSGEGCSSTTNTSVYQLRERMISDLFSRSKIPMIDKLGLLIKSFNYFISQKYIKVLTFKLDKEGFPVVK